VASIKPGLAQRTRDAAGAQAPAQPGTTPSTG
jgi:hypothetical protein